MSDKSDIIIYQTDDGLTKIDVRLEDDTVWLTQAEMAELFQKNVSTISKYSLQGTTQGRYLTGGVPPVRFSM